MLSFLYKKEYEKAANDLRDLLKRKDKRHDALYYAAQISKSYSHVDPKKLVKMVEHKELMEAAYLGNLGIMELIKFQKKASQKQKSMLQSYIEKKNDKKIRELIADVTGVKLKKIVNEEIKPDILPKAGAGQDGTDELVKTYMRDTPGQKYKKFRDYIK
jgi:hypothetical protein